MSEHHHGSLRTNARNTNMPLTQTKPREEAFNREPQSYPPVSTVTSVGEPDPTRYLRIALRLVGLTFTIGIYTLIIVWPSGWSWHTGHSHYLPHYLQMILGVYATLGVFLLIASRNPLAHLSLIWFTVWSSVAHAGIMAAQSLVNSEHRGHLLGDVPALLVVSAVLAVLTPRGKEATALAAGKK
jgi:Family of unknown function (DUF6632)